MEKNGQLTFSDDPLIKDINGIYLLIENGQFSEAVEKLDPLLDEDPDYPGLISAYRTARFWHNRDDKLKKLPEGKETANFLMEEWQLYEEYAESKAMKESTAYTAVMKRIFSVASENYRLSYRRRELSNADNYDLLLKLGSCFLRLEDYQKTVDTLEFAKSSYNPDGRLLFILAEAYYHLNDIPKSLLYFREGFLIDPGQADLTAIKAKPILELREIASAGKKDSPDIREWMPVYGYVNDIFYVRRNISKNTVDTLSSELFNLEKSYVSMSAEQIAKSSILPRIINKYLWLLDFYEYQSYNYENISQIRERLIKLEPVIFKEYFARKSTLDRLR
jgi:tetratricopeptide (TPR) repeat protein